MRWHSFWLWGTVVLGKPEKITGPSPLAAAAAVHWKGKMLGTVALVIRDELLVMLKCSE